MCVGSSWAQALEDALLEARGPWPGGNVVPVGADDYQTIKVISDHPKRVWMAQMCLDGWHTCLVLRWTNVFGWHKSQEMNCAPTLHPNREWWFTTMLVYSDTKATNTNRGARCPGPGNHSTRNKDATRNNVS